MIVKHISFSICMVLAWVWAFAQRTQSINTPEEIARTDAYAQQLESYLKQYLVDDYEKRASTLWQRDYSSPDALIRSVAPNRRRWEAILNPPVLRKTGPLQERAFSLDGLSMSWIELPLGPVTAQAILAFPDEISVAEPVPLIIVQHGIASAPETTFRGGNYHSYAKALVQAGYAVLVPLNLRSIERRNHIERLCRLAGTSLPGIELARTQHLLDVVLADPRVNADQVGMWGVSLGGMATMFWMPLESRIKAGVVSAWFNKRATKMAVADDRYVSFIATDEDHAFFNSWLTEFSDDDVVSLICPRPLLIHHGKKDKIAHWPQVMEEFDAAKIHYQKLDMAERIEITLHEGGHEAIVETGIAFLDRWIKLQ